MRKIFVDLGAYDGDSIRYFMKREDAREYDIYAFEPNPIFHQRLANLWLEFPNIVMLSNEAAWIENGTMEFAQDQASDPMGSTLMKGKAEIWAKSNSITVNTFDFPTWLEQFADDYVIVKMDIEGAEFPILLSMLNTGTLNYMNELWCEFHPNKVREYTTTDKINLMAELSKELKLTEWH